MRYTYPNSLKCHGIMPVCTLVILGVLSCPHVPRYIYMYMYLQYASKKSYHTVEINRGINGPGLLQGYHTLKKSSVVEKPLFSHVNVRSVD